jgi:hypothetical protein
MAASSGSRSYAGPLMSDRQHFRIGIFAFLHQLRSFQISVFATGRLFRMSHLSSVATYRFLAKMPLSDAPHFNRFVFRHQLKQLRRRVSGFAVVF